MAGPLSVEDILAKQKAEREAAAKPKFLSKSERAALALEKRNAEVKAQQEKDEAERSERSVFERQVEEERRKADGARYGGGDGRYERYGGNGNGNMNGRDGRYGGRDGGFGGRGGYNNGNGRDDRYNRPGQGGSNGYNNQNGYQNGQRGPSGGHHTNGPPHAPTGPRGSAPPTGPRASQLHTPANSSPLGNTSSPKPSAPGDVAPPTDAELDTIRARYLGNNDNKKKPRLRKVADKKVIFDWNTGDDTSTTKQKWSEDAQGGLGGTMFGGRLAGMDEAGKDKRDGGELQDNHADALERRRAGRGNNDERHWSDKPLEEMKDRDWRIFREDYSIAARGGSIPLPLRTWRESTIPATILDIIDDVGYTEPSPIQRQAIPIGMQNRDLIGIAKTGSGKTAAFVIPMLDYISHLPPLDDENRHKGPYALIMAPTRELAQQIESETVKFAAGMGYTCVSIIGGRSVEEQQFALRDGAHIIIATPGRLKDMIDKSMLVMSQCRYVVMDEADRMVDLGFEIDLNFILDAMPATFAKPDTTEALAAGGEWKGWRVTTLFSATMPPPVQRLALKYLRKPATVTIGNAGEAVDTVDQRVEFVQGEEKKKARLIEILRSGGFAPPLIVFVNQKKTSEVVVKYVYQAGLSATTLHSDKNQAQREAALQSLRDGEVSVLVATDIAGRGIDVPDVSAVINWQMSDTIEKYVHRIGRTGRAGKLGTAITFLDNGDEEVMFELKNEITRSKLSTMNPELAKHEAARQKITREMKRKRDEQADE